MEFILSDLLLIGHDPLSNWDTSSTYVVHICVSSAANIICRLQDRLQSDLYDLVVMLRRKHYWVCNHWYFDIAELIPRVDSGVGQLL